MLAYSWLADAYMDLNDLSTAERYLSDLDEKVNASGYQWGIAWTKQAFAGLAFVKGDTASWIRLLQEALDLYTEFGDEWSVKNISETLIWQKYLRGEIEDAARLTKQSILLYEKDEEAYRIANCYGRLGTFAYFQGQYEIAQQYFSDRTNIFTEIGFSGQVAIAKEAIAFVLYIEGRIEEAKSHYLKLITQLKGVYVSDSLLFGIIHARYAFVCLYEEHLSEARESLEVALSALQKWPSAEEIYMVYFGFGELARLENNYPEAIKNYHTSLRYANNFLAHIYFPEILDGLAKAKYLQSNFDKATRLFGTSHALRKRMGAVIHPVDHPDYDKYIELLKSQMSAEEFESAWAEGAKMSIEELFAFAMQDGER